MEVTNTYTQLYGYQIKVYDRPYPTGNVVVCLRWEGFSFSTFLRFMWYFEYRYALLRVKHPKAHITHGQFTHELTKKAASDILKNKISAKKRKITEYKNKLSMAERSWQSIFPIEEDETYKNAVGKIARLQFELVELEKQII